MGVGLWRAVSFGCLSPLKGGGYSLRHLGSDHNVPGLRPFIKKNKETMKEMGITSGNNKYYNP